ncbi:MAG: prepilin-type N-terminal cleavage/methylation domain-containing protein, partial [Cytophagales bacterium]|nr:prepilin-type N-terminal cleavage/methylation domain-containing protein [Cytophagales bacterium]
MNKRKLSNRVKNRLRAFTILELLVVLMLGVIVTGIAYSIYSIL